MCISVISIILPNSRMPNYKRGIYSVPRCWEILCRKWCRKDSLAQSPSLFSPLFLLSTSRI